MRRLMGYTTTLAGISLTTQESDLWQVHIVTIEVRELLLQRLSRETRCTSREMAQTNFNHVFRVPSPIGNFITPLLQTPIFQPN